MRKLTEMRKSSLDRLFMLKRDVSLAEDLTRLRICAQELLSVKVKRQIGSNRYLYFQLKIIVWVFLPIKAKEVPTVGLPSHHLMWGAHSRQNLMRARSVYLSARNVPWTSEKTLALMEDKA